MNIFIKEKINLIMGRVKMDINNLTIIIAFINLLIFIVIPIGIVVFIVKIVKSQKRMKSDIELLNRRLSKLENK